MRHLRSTSLLLLITAVLVAVLAPGAVLAQGPREEPRIQVAGPEDVPLGNTARIMARLEDAQGNPIPNATIVFTIPTAFAGTVAEMNIGEAQTNAEGIAILDYQLRIEGQNQFIARFYGTDTYQPADDSAVVLATGTKQLAQRTEGVRVPVLGSWTLVVVLLGVWSVYLVVLFLVSQIPEARGRSI